MRVFSAEFRYIISLNLIVAEDSSGVCKTAVKHTYFHTCFN